MLDEAQIDLVLAIYSILIAGIFLRMENQKVFPPLWAIGTLLSSIASLIFFFRHLDVIFRVYGNILWLIGGAIIAFTIIQEYYQKKSQSNKHPNIANFSLVLSYTMIIFQESLIITIQLVQFTFCIILLCTIILMIKMYLNEKSITHVFMLMTLIAVLLILIFSILSNLGIGGSWEIAYIMKIIFYTALLATGLSSPIERKLQISESVSRESQNRVEFYKDLFMHDMNNILQGILTSTELIELLKNNLIDPARLVKYVSIIRGQIERGNELINNVKKLSIIESQNLSLEKIEAVSVIEKAISYVKTKFQTTDIEAQIDCKIGKVRIFGNQLFQDVIDNLLINGVEHNENSVIKIFIKISRVNKEKSDYIKIEFVDNGIGIANGFKSSIFQRGEKKSKASKGMGLGLSLVKKIMGSINGAIWVEDAVKGDYTKGSNFILLIPEALNDD